MSSSAMDSKFSGEIFRKDQKMILAANRHLASIKPVRLGYVSGGYVAGEVLARDPADGLFKAYDDDGASGVATAACILLDDITMPTENETVLSKAVFGGEVFEGELTGLDANAKSDLDAKTITDATGVAILKF